MEAEIYALVNVSHAYIVSGEMEMHIPARSNEEAEEKIRDLFPSLDVEITFPDE